MKIIKFSPQKYGVELTNLVYTTIPLPNIFRKLLKYNFCMRELLLAAQELERVPNGIAVFGVNNNFMYVTSLDKLNQYKIDKRKYN